MASVSDVNAATDAISLPCTTLKWPYGKPPQMPYAVLVPHEAVPQYADGGINYMCRRYDLELYMRELDYPLMDRLAESLRDSGMGRAHAHDVAIDETNQFVIAYYPLTIRE